MLAKNIWDLCHYQKSDAKKNTQKNMLDLGDYKKNSTVCESLGMLNQTKCSILSKNLVC